jgi:hypothetical protein
LKFRTFRSGADNAVYCLLLKAQRAFENSDARGNRYCGVKLNDFFLKQKKFHRSG